MTLEGIDVIDGWIGFPGSGPKPSLASLHAQLRERDRETASSPVEYLFDGKPPGLEGQDPVDVTLAEMDRYDIAIGIVQLDDGPAMRAVQEHPDRFRATLPVDPNEITASVRAIRAAHAEHAIVGVYSFPAGCLPQVPASDRRYYPIYQTCVDLDIPMVMNAGITGPRVPSDCQHVLHFEQVCYDFPELRVVMCHGGEPWEDLAAKLLLKWPGLYYMTSAFAPKHYPKAIVDFANTRGSRKILYGGYFPDGLTLERIFSELPAVPFRAQVWPRFLHHNAREVFKL